MAGSKGDRSKNALGCLTALLLTLLAFLFFASNYGDPGYVYEPNSGRNQRIGSVRFDMTRWMTLTGSANLLQTLTIENGSEKDVVILGGTLVSGSRTFEAELPGQGEPKWGTVPPGATASPFLYWEYGSSLDAEDALGEEIEWRWRVEVEGEERTIRFTMKREP